MQLLTIKGGWSMNRRFDIRNGCVRILRDDQTQETTLTVKDDRVTEAEDIEYPGDGTVTTRDRNEIDRAKAGAIRTVSRYEAYRDIELPHCRSADKNANSPRSWDQRS